MRLETAIQPASSHSALDAGEPAEEMRSPNAELRELVAGSGLTPAVAMTIFNRQLGAAACSESEWRGYMAEPGSAQYRKLSEAQLAHAVAQFARIGVHRPQ